MPQFSQTKSSIVLVKVFICVIYVPGIIYQISPKFKGWYLGTFAKIIGCKILLNFQPACSRRRVAQANFCKVPSMSTKWYNKAKVIMMEKRHKNYNFSKYKFAFLGLGAALALLGIWLLVSGSNFQVLNPKGIIAHQERQLMITAILLMLAVVIPMFVAAFVIARKYRAGNPGAIWAPDLDRHTEIEFIWWAIPSIVVIILATMTWKSTHALDPFKRIESSTRPLTIQVVALQWKWLFIYPEQNIATVNFVEFPAGTPIDFTLTADAPMNSFWIPQLGGQMYAMAGMSTHLNLMASETGDFNGSAAEINGRGFAGMKFVAKAISQSDFDAWVKSVKKSPNTLSLAEYEKLASPSENNPKTFYSSAQKGLYDDVIMKFMPASSMDGMLMP
jgi:cytochrome o ubiquinol oxidase subunit 2